MIVEGGLVMAAGGGGGGWLIAVVHVLVRYPVWTRNCRVFARPRVCRSFRNLVISAAVGRNNLAQTMGWVQLP